MMAIMYVSRQTPPIYTQISFVMFFFSPNPAYFNIKFKIILQSQTRIQQTQPWSATFKLLNLCFFFFFKLQALFQKMLKSLCLLALQQGKSETPLSYLVDLCFMLFVWIEVSAVFYFII